MRRRLTTATTAALAAALLLAGCSSGESVSPPENAPEQTEAASSPPPSDFPTLPVGEPFGKAAWGVQVVSAGGGEGATPIVTGDRLVVLSGPNVHADDETGAQVWTVIPEPLDGTGADPILRLVSEDVVALISQGQSSGEGLDADVYAARVTLWSLATEPGCPSTASRSTNLGVGAARFCACARVRLHEDAGQPTCRPADALWVSCRRQRVIWSITTGGRVTTTLELWSVLDTPTSRWPDLAAPCCNQLARILQSDGVTVSRHCDGRRFNGWSAAVAGLVLVSRCFEQSRSFMSSWPCPGPEHLGTDPPVAPRRGVARRS